VTEPDVQLALIAEAGPLKVSREVFCVFELAGEPRAWQRAGARIARDAAGQQFIAFFTPTEENIYRQQIAWMAKAAMRGRAPTIRPCALLMHAFMPIMKSWTTREKIDARNGAAVPVGKPDADNFLKLMDALTGLVFVDDAQVVDARCIKRFSETPALRVEVKEFVPAGLK
jgi:Holliday junction resolvase RusA-like endonuclease